MSAKRSRRACRSNGRRRARREASAVSAFPASPGRRGPTSRPRRRRTAAPRSRTHAWPALLQLDERSGRGSRLLVLKPILNHSVIQRCGFGNASHIFGVLPPQCGRAFAVNAISSSGQNVIQIFSSCRRRGHRRDAGCFSLRQAFAQSDDADSGNADPAAGKPVAATDRPERGTAIPQPAARRPAEAARRLRRPPGGPPQAAQPAAAQPSIAALPPVQPNSRYRQPGLSASPAGL